jgi:hypothetical protein
MDFFQICVREIESGPKKGTMELYPDFKIGRSKDLMVRGKSFYAIWDEEQQLWSTDEYDVQRLVDKALYEYSEKHKAASGISYAVKYLRSASSGGWYQFRKYMQNISDNSTQLDQDLTFANTDVKKTDYVSRRLPYSLESGDISAWDELVGTLYSVEERAKIEWAIGAVISGDAKKIQKFLVFYGPGGTGKSTILNIIEKLFVGYTTTFEAKALGSANGAFATEVFKHNPLVAIQQDGDLSRIDDNTKLNSIIAHEDMTMNEKYKPSYTSRVNAFLFMGTNQPVKISDAKSGIIRRLIDVHPTGVRIAPNHYHALLSRIDFELGAIAQHCLDVYRDMGKNYYNAYRPTEMMLQTDVFFNFIEANFDIFKEQDSTSLKQAYMLYKEFCNETGIERMLPQYKVREELRNYFDEFKDRATVDGAVVRSYYSGFNANKFKQKAAPDKPFTLVVEDETSVLDDIFASQPAQYATAYGTPKKKWSEIKTTLSDLDTSELHFVKIPENHIVIDFDLKDEATGEKSLEKNLEAASSWPSTYAEYSQGGGGIHLHYDYDGDVAQLAAEYSKGIEVKTLLGDASLRRRLSRCNNVPVAILKPGTLPIKEVKVLDVNHVKSEKNLRDMINRNFAKEFHAGTKPSIDFIKHILDEAYEKGSSYDVSDLEPKLITFASSSTNQSLIALKTVREMKLRGKEQEAEHLKTETTFSSPDGLVTAAMPRDERIVFWDVEVYPNLFVICWKFRGSPDIVRMINPTPQEVEMLLGLKLVGFYNRRYDNHILYARMLGYTNEQLFKLSQKLITEKNTASYFGEAFGISYADIWDFSSIKQSLKKFMIDLGITKMEMNLPWDQPVKDEDIPKVVEYCCNDVEGTEATFEDRYQDFVARQILAELSGLSVNDTTQKHTARIIFGTDRNPQASFEYTKLEKEFPGYKFDQMQKTGKSSYKGEDPSEGGYVFSKPGMYENVGEWDIASMHPTSIEQLNLFGEYTPNFAALKAARLAIKHGDYDSAEVMLGGKLKPYLQDREQAEALSYALKIVINIVYGLTSAKFDNPFRDRRNVDNIVAKRGALFMIDLKNACLEEGYNVVHIKTDSIKIANATPEAGEFITNFGAKYGYDFEHEATYERFCLVNDAVYIAKYGWAAKASKIGKWVGVGAQFQHPYVFKKLFSREEPTFDDMCETKQVQKGAIYMDFEHDKPEPKIDRMHFVGKIGRFVPVTEACGGAVLYRHDDKLYKVTGTTGHLWLDAGQAAMLGDKLEIDTSYYDKLLDKAYKAVSAFGNFERFTA